MPKIYLITLPLIIIFSSSCIKKQCVPREPDDLRQYLSEQALITAIGLEELKFKNNNDYPIWTSIELHTRILTVHGHTENHFKEFHYEPDGDNYYLYIITDYRVCEQAKLTVIKMESGKIFWKDNFAEDKQRIHDLDWGKVTFLAVNVQKDNKSPEGRFNLPAYVQ